MSLLRSGIEALVKQNNVRPPQTAVATGTNFGEGSPAGLFQQLQQPANSSWLFAVINRIATSVAMTEWQLQAVRPDGAVRVINNHPFWTLWNNWNEWTNSEEGLEIIQQHLSLVGEAWMVLLRNSRGAPVEIWPVRPDRMQVIPDTQRFIRGYRYRIGNVTIDLEPEDVLMIRRPSPIDPYRGAGPIASLMADLMGEKAAAQWNANFFKNSAEPGGVIEYDENLSDTDFERLVARWNLQHRGIGNAHRVAIIERGQWKDRKVTMRDMQFEQLRKFDRDLILGAYGMPRTVLGLTEGVNRATAEAANFVFAERVVLPELVRIRNGVNDRLLSKFGRSDLRLAFVNPVPENSERLLEEAVRGYEKGILTRNEARTRLGEDPVADGDDFAPAPVQNVRGARVVPPETKRNVFPIAKPKQPALEAPERPTDTESDLEAAWRERLETEAESIVSALFPNEQRRSWRRRGPGVEVSDVDALDWDWWTRYGPAVIEELREGWLRAAVAAGTSANDELLKLRAAQYAETRGARLLRLDGDLNVVEATRARVRTVVAQGIRDGQGPGTVARQLRDDYIFSAKRANTVARTESVSAFGQARKTVAIEAGEEEKRWVTQGDSLVRAEHVSNAAVGWIPVADAFPSGQDTIGDGPAHLVVDCRCTVIYRRRPIEGAGLTLIPEARCPAGHLIGKYVSSGVHYCRHCKQNVTIGRVDPDSLPVEGHKRVSRTMLITDPDDPSHIIGVERIEE